MNDSTIRAALNMRIDRNSKHDVNKWIMEAIHLYQAIEYSRYQQFVIHFFKLNSVHMFITSLTGKLYKSI